MVYIGNLDAAKEKLTKNQIALNTVNIGNTELALLQFFADVCGISWCIYSYDNMDAKSIYFD